MAESETETPDTRTVELRTDQAEALKSLGGESDTYKTIVDDLLEQSDGDVTVDVDAAEVAEEVIDALDGGSDAAQSDQIDAEDLADAVAAKVSKDVDTRLSAIEERLDELEGRGR